MKRYGRKDVVYVGFMDLEKAYDRVNGEALTSIENEWCGCYTVEWYKEYIY